MTNQGKRHVPVLLKDAIEFLNVRTGTTVADCTLGMAGHAAEIVSQAGPARPSHRV
jgi:16S rRNA (cytosine1402-N4)-methyltransferase